MIKVNGIELENPNLLDLRVVEGFEKALIVLKGMPEKIEGMRVSESIRTQCNAIFNIFNILWGEGTDKRIFGDEVNLLTCIKAFDELINQINNKDFGVNKIINKYSPNRVQRRAKK